jgi:mono/diheme cytochrome c family protein
MNPCWIVDAVPCCGFLSRRLLPGLVAVLFLSCPALSHGADDEVSFVRDIAPVLTRHCTGCHGPTKVEGDYRLHTFAALQKTGASDSPTLTPGQPEQSELYLRLIDENESTRMPQLDDPLSASEIALVEGWIRQGARFDGRDPNVSFKSQMPPRTHPPAPAMYRVAVPVQACVFSPAGTEVAVGGHHEVTIWNPQTGALLRRLGGLPKRIQSIVYEPAGTRLLVAGGTPGDYGEIVALDATDGGNRQVLQTAEDLVLSIALSHDGRHLASGGADRVVRSFTRDEQGRWSLTWDSRLFSDWITEVAYGARDEHVLVACRDYTAKVLTPEGVLFTTYNGHQRQFGSENGRFEVYALAAEADGPRIFTAGLGRSIRMWEAARAQVENGSAADMEERFAQAGHTKYLPHDAKRGVFKLATAGNQLFAATGEGRLRQYGLPEGKLLREYPSQNDWLFGLALHPGTQRAITTTRTGIARVWNTETGELVQEWLCAPGLTLDAASRLAKP